MSRILVDRVWPRGMTGKALNSIRLNGAPAPGTALRKWYNHDHFKWEIFKSRYFSELIQTGDDKASS